MFPPSTPRHGQGQTPRTTSSDGSSPKEMSLFVGSPLSDAPEARRLEPPSDDEGAGAEEAQDEEGEEGGMVLPGAGGASPLKRWHIASDS